MAGLAAAQMSGGSEFHAAGPACEKVHSPNLAQQNVQCFSKLWYTLTCHVYTGASPAEALGFAPTPTETGIFTYCGPKMLPFNLTS